MILSLKDDDKQFVTDRQRFSLLELLTEPVIPFLFPLSAGFIILLSPVISECK